MTKLQVKNWQHLAIGLLGAWFAVSPWALHVQANRSVATVSVILGVALLASAIVSVAKPRPAQDWVSASLGLIAAVAPWLVGFASEQTATRNAEAVGWIVLLLAVWTLVREGELRSLGAGRLAR